MVARALLILLVVLNLGVALWWATRAEPAGRNGTPEAPQGVARLQLASEASLPATPADAPSLATDAPAEPLQGPVQCVALGPYADAVAVERARAAVAALVVQARPRIEMPAGRGWRVLLPAQADRAAADAVAARLRQAGFADLYVIAEGSEANAIALGRFGSQAAAGQHASRLREAGFEARAEAIGAAAQHWLDVALDDAAADAVRHTAGVQRAEAIDCGRLR